MKRTSPDLSDRLDFACQIARSAGELTLRYFLSEIPVDRKADASPVTIADREAEQLLRKAIADHFPSDAILGEEFGEQPGASGFRWILDPIDGTKSFITGVPLYGTLVGVQYEGESVIGVIEHPALDVRVYAARGGGAFWQRGVGAAVPARVATVESLGEATFLTTEVSAFADRGASRVYETLQAACWYTRTWGDCYGYFLVAIGKASLMIDPIMNLWDAVAIQPILEEAGGVFTDWAGVATSSAGEGIGTNRSILPQVLAITRDYRKR